MEFRFQRLELKYLIDESTAARIKADLLPYCRPDSHNDSQRGCYPIFSLYLDSPGLAFYQAKKNSEFDRVKLRIRTYSAHSPAHLEVKRKCGDVIDKSRVAVDRTQCRQAASGFAPTPRNNPASEGYLERFVRIKSLTGAEPVELVRYDREAYVSSVDRYARVTFDRRCVAQRVSDWELEGDPDEWCSLAGEWLSDGQLTPVLLELKCETMMPWWMSELVQRHDLRLRGFSKYCRGIEVTDMWKRGINISPGPRGAFV